VLSSRAGDALVTYAETSNGWFEPEHRRILPQTTFACEQASRPEMQDIDLHLTDYSSSIMLSK
jgi:hypothetical protein